MSKGLLLCMFLVGFVTGSIMVTGYMFLSDNSPLMVRQIAFDDMSDSYISLAKEFGELLDSLNEESKIHR